MSGDNKYLLDTNIILGFLNGHKLINVFFESKLTATGLHISQVTRMELLGYPLITFEEESCVNQFLSFVEVLPINDLVCDKTIGLRKSTRLKLPDAIIAATAIIHNLILISCDSAFVGSSDELQSINPCAG